MDQVATNPIDETEALLAVQMAAIHKATMVAAARLARVETIPQQDSASNLDAVLTHELGRRPMSGYGSVLRARFAR